MPVVYFPDRQTFQGHEFEGGKLYDLRDEPNGFVERWFIRGCKLVEDVHEGAEVLPDPRPLPEDEKAPVVKHEEIVKATKEPVQSEEDEEAEKEVSSDEISYMLQSRGGPYFNVVRSDGKVMNTKAMYKVEAEAYVKELTAIG